MTGYFIVGMLCLIAIPLVLPQCRKSLPGASLLEVFAAALSWPYYGTKTLRGVVAYFARKALAR